MMTNVQKAYDRVYRGGKPVGQIVARTLAYGGVHGYVDYTHDDYIIFGKDDYPLPLSVVQYGFSKKND